LMVSPEAELRRISCHFMMEATFYLIRSD
jgi:hypothetical protein